MAVETPSKPSLWNLPNKITISRLGLGVILFILIEWRLWIGCILVFVAIAATDWLDGYYARKLGLVSALGRMLDPLVDKIVVCGAFILLLTLNQVQFVGSAISTGLAGWMVVLIVGREFLVTGIRSLMEQEGIPFGADLWGKLKMVLQCAVLLAIFTLFAVEFPSSESEGTPVASLRLMSALVLIRDVLLWAMLLVTVVSGLNYCWKAAQGLTR
jgi:CDP-diacylglycerol--glycerol-3-phosphate 3-phosphatidyltransferase